VRQARATLFFVCFVSFVRFVLAVSPWGSTRGCARGLLASYG